MVPLILLFVHTPFLMMILLLTRLESTYLKASNSVEARLESKENSESGQSQIYNAGDLQKVIFLSQWRPVVEVIVCPAPGTRFHLLCLLSTGDQISYLSFLISQIEWDKVVIWYCVAQATGAARISSCLWGSRACGTPHLPWQSFWWSSGVNCDPSRKIWLRRFFTGELLIVSNG